ncbi:MAG: NifB/NifX family molybdenum-iron cluster-binding protein [Anaerolineales bacterium]|nr:NifB/NifX family molybdenum-iron cluster-binding protein [Anaerolineales bacterium]
MKIAITAEKPNLESELDPRFGRCNYFLVVETDDRSFEALENIAAGAGGGAGPQAAQFIAEHGVEAVVSGDFGPNAFRALTAAGMKLYKANVKPISDVVDAFEAGELIEVSEASGPSHKGMGSSAR